MSGSLGQRDQVEIREAIDEESEQELTTEGNNTTSGKDEEEGNDESFDSRLSFKAWLAQINEQPTICFDTLPDLNEAYAQLLKDATRCDTAFPEHLRQWGGGGVYSYENFLLTFNSDDPSAKILTSGTTSRQRTTTTDQRTDVQTRNPDLTQFHTKLRQAANHPSKLLQRLTSRMSSQLVYSIV
jgi:hypothetical protein